MIDHFEVSSGESCKWSSNELTGRKWRWIQLLCRRLVSTCTWTLITTIFESSSPFPLKATVRIIYYTLYMDGRDWLAAYISGAKIKIRMKSTITTKVNDWGGLVKLRISKPSQKIGFSCKSRLRCSTWLLRGLLSRANLQGDIMALH